MPLISTRTPDWELWLYVLAIIGLLFLGFMLLGFGTAHNKKTRRYPYVMATLLFATMVAGVVVNYQNAIADPVAAKAMPGAVYRVGDQQLREWAQENYGLTYTGVGEYNNFIFSDSEEGKSCTYQIFKVTPLKAQDTFALQAQLVCDGKTVPPKQ